MELAFVARWLAAFSCAGFFFTTPNRDGGQGNTGDFKYNKKTLALLPTETGLIVVIGGPWRGPRGTELSLSALRLLCKLRSCVNGPLRTLLTTVASQHHTE